MEPCRNTRPLKRRRKIFTLQAISGKDFCARAVALVINLTNNGWDSFHKGEMCSTVCLFSICFCCLIYYLLHPNPNIKLLTFSGFNVKMSSFPETHEDVLVSPLGGKKKGKRTKTVRGCTICLSFIFLTLHW